MITTVSDAIGRFGVDVDDHHDRQLTIPVLSGPQAQGDLIVVPVRAAAGTVITNVPQHKAQQVGPTGIPVIRGEAGGNTHLLLASGVVYWLPEDRAEDRLGGLIVPDGSTAYLAHPEHGYAGIAPGVYAIRRQREQADAIRLVAD